MGVAVAMIAKRIYWRGFLFVASLAMLNVGDEDFLRLAKCEFDPIDADT